jgi:hypothetical protein
VGGEGGPNANGQSAGAAGSASASATAVSTSPGAAATAVAQEQGGGGGYGYLNANGLPGAGEDAVNIVGGSTAGGSLDLSQTAIGGIGGDSNGAYASGAGGAATSSLTFDDTKSTTQSDTLTGTSRAEGGAGGVNFSGSGGQAGGAASASIALTGAGSAQVNANAIASGGAAQGDGPQAVGGGATATATGHSGGDLEIFAHASGGLGDTQLGTAAATTTADGVSGQFTALAEVEIIWSQIANCSPLGGGWLRRLEIARGSAPKISARLSGVRSQSSARNPATRPATSADSRDRLCADGCTLPFSQRLTTDLSTASSAASLAALIDSSFRTSRRFSENGVVDAIAPPRLYNPQP